MLTPTTHKAFRGEYNLGNRQGIRPSPMPQGIAAEEKKRERVVLTLSFNNRDGKSKPENIDAAITFAQACLKALGDGETEKDNAWREIIVSYAKRISEGRISVADALEGVYSRIQK